MKLVFLIPARSGSTRIKNKNLTKINGVSILENKIRVCLNTNLGKVYVSTDSKKIAKISNLLGAKTLKLRSKKLSTSYASMLSVVVDFLRKYLSFYNELPDYILLVPATNPFLKKKTIIKAIKKLIRNKNYNSLISIYKSTEDPFSLINCKNHKIQFKLFQFKNKNYFSFERSQDKPSFMKISSALQITRAKYFIKYLKNKKKKEIDKPFDPKKCIGELIQPIEAIDINTKKDLYIIKNLLKNKILFDRLYESFY